MRAKIIMISSLTLSMHLFGFVPPDYGRMDDEQMEYEMRQNGPKMDRDLAIKVINELKGGGYKRRFEDISVEVHDGRVTLRGTVKSLKASSEIEERVRKVQGVSTVDNKIVVKSGATIYDDGY